MQPIKKSIFPFFSLISTKIANFYKCLPVLLDEPVIALFSLKQVTEWSLSNLKHLENKLRKLDKKWGVRYKTVPPSVSLTCEGICPPLLMRKKRIILIFIGNTSKSFNIGCKIFWARCVSSIGQHTSFTPPPRKNNLTMNFRLWMECRPKNMNNGLFVDELSFLISLGTTEFNKV